MDKQKRQYWAGIPWQFRYSNFAGAPKTLVTAMRKIDPLLDLKFYMPTEKWHVVRYYKGLSDKAKFTRVWECADNPQLGTCEGLGMWIIDGLKAGRLLGRDICNELDAHNSKIEARNAKKHDDACNEISKDMILPLQNMEERGMLSDTHYGYRVTGTIVGSDGGKCT